MHNYYPLSLCLTQQYKAAMSSVALHIESFSVFYLQKSFTRIKQLNRI